MKKHPQSGFAHLMFLLLLAAVLAVAAVSYKVVKDRQVKSRAGQTSTTVGSSSQPIKNTSDLDSAAGDLNSQAVDADLNPSQLDDDISSLL